MRTRRCAFSDSSLCRQMWCLMMKRRARVSRSQKGKVVMMEISCTKVPIFWKIIRRTPVITRSTCRTCYSRRLVILLWAQGTWLWPTLASTKLTRWTRDWTHWRARKLNIMQRLRHVRTCRVKSATSSWTVRRSRLSHSGSWTKISTNLNVSATFSCRIRRSAWWRTWVAHNFTKCSIHRRRLRTCFCSLKVPNLKSTKISRMYRISANNYCIAPSSNWLLIRRKWRNAICRA